MNNKKENNMSFETYKSIYLPSEDVVIRHGQAADFTFNCSKDEITEKSYRLFFTGETTLFYFWKGEYDCVPEYCNIEDALDNKRAKIAPYCLDLSNPEPVNYPKVTFKKTVFPPKLSYLMLHSYTDDWKAGVFVKAEDLKLVKDDGHIRVTYEVRYLHDGMPPYATINEADEVYSFDIPTGTYDWTEYGMELNLPKDKMANVVCYIEAEGYVGTLLLERPYLTSSNGYNVLPDFQPPYLAHDTGSWLGHNLSRKEWPEFEISLNGKVFFEGEMFERCHKYSECECTLPAELLQEGENKLSIKLVSSYPNPMPYSIHEVGCFISDAKRINVIACPENVTTNGKAALLIKTCADDVDVELVCPSGLLTAQKQRFAKAGYDVFVMNTSTAANDVEFTLVSGDCKLDGKILRIVEKCEDNVTTGTGDIIYVNQEKLDDFAEYISWYYSNNIGNLLTIRPTYRWSGSRVLNPEVWKFVVDITNKLGFKYVHMTDGREFPGSCANPSLEMLEGEGFMGRQSHEYDGAFGYWGHPEVTGIYDGIADYWMKLIRENVDTVNSRTMARNYKINPQTGKMYQYVDPYSVPADMEKAAEHMVWNLSESRWDHTRHTGPSVSFKYFIQAGYDWSGAELMYGPLEMITAFMRGAAYCYDKATIGGHLAIQWSTTPHDTPDRFRRYRASLYSSYIQGIHDINTEEGLWHMEEYYNAFNRKSDACLGHTVQQQDFYRYVSSHSRTGEFHTDMAFIFGRYDGFRSFGVNTVFAREDMDSAAPEFSWELLNIFYPLEVANGEIYLHPCPNDREIGMLTGTPRGNVDVIPMECDGEKLLKYKVLSFLGYNKALPEDMDKLENFVCKGGKLIIGLPHMAVTTKRDEVVNYAHDYIDHAFAKRFIGELDFVTDTVDGEPVTVNKGVNLDGATVMSTTDNGEPLVVCYNVGDGAVYFVNAKEYPAEKGVEKTYRELITALSDKVNSEEKAFVECDDKVQFAIFDQADGTRHMYILAVDWYRDPAIIRNAQIINDGVRFPVDVRFGEMLKVVVNGNIAAWMDGEGADVVSVADGVIKLQGRGVCDLFIADSISGKLEKRTVDFGGNGIVTVNI